MRNLDDVIAALPSDRRALIERRAQKLVQDEHTLQRVRRARSFTQAQLAEVLHVDQAAISRIEQRGDMLLSTMRSYIEAMGGKLTLRAEFPDGAMDLATIGEVAAEAARVRLSKPTVRRRSKVLKEV